MKTRNLGIIAVTILLLISGALLFDDIKRSVFEPTPTDLEKGVSAENVSYEVEAEDLSVPWDIEFLPDDDMLVTERPGYLLRIGGINDTYEVPGVEEAGEGGLLGIALHP